MRLPPGATGFNADPGSGLALPVFAAICHHAARTTGAAVHRVTPAGPTPNFHTADLVGDRRTAVLGHVTVPIIAFAAPRRPGDAFVTFTDEPALAAAVREVSDVVVLTAAQADAPVSSADLTALDAGEHAQIAYWGPSTVGELLFNFWD